MQSIGIIMIVFFFTLKWCKTLQRNVWWSVLRLSGSLWIYAATLWSLANMHFAIPEVQELFTDEENKKGQYTVVWWNVCSQKSRSACLSTGYITVLFVTANYLIFKRRFVSCECYSDVQLKAEFADILPPVVFPPKKMLALNDEEVGWYVWSSFSGEWATERLGEVHPNSVFTPLKSDHFRSAKCLPLQRATHSFHFSTMPRRFVKAV